METIKSVWSWAVAQADAHPRIFLIWAVVATLIAVLH
jgi:hypothetical protein